MSTPGQEIPTYDTRGQIGDATEALSLPASSAASSSQLNPYSENEKRNGLDATSLAKWNRLAAKGGIGKAVALEDCMANRKGDLMFLSGDEITVLRMLTENIFLGHCEGVIGRFYLQHVRLPTGLSNTAPLNSSTSMSRDPLSTSSSADDSFHSLPRQEASTLDTIAPKRGAEPSGMPEDMLGVAKNSPVTDTKDTVGKETRQTETSDDTQPPNDPQHVENTTSRSSTAEQPEELFRKMHSSASSISSTWSNHSNLEAQSEGHLTAAQSVAVALRGFATESKDRINEEESEFGRRYHSRESSLHGSEISWSSARESDEVSEGSIRYPTTVSLIDRMKAMRLPASYQSTDASSPGSEVPAADEAAERSLSANVNRSSQRGSVTMAKAILLPMSPPARPEKHRLRSQHSGGSEQVSSISETEAVAANVEIERGEEVRHRAELAQAEAQDHVTVADVQLEEPECQKEAAAETLSVMTGESNPFEFGTGVSAASTPNEIVGQAPVHRTTANPVPSDYPQIQNTVDPSNGTKHADDDISAGPVQGHKAASSSLSVIRELANRFSTASEIMRKHHVDDGGVQSYFPGIAEGETPPPAEKALEVFCTPPMAASQIESDPIEPKDGPQTAGPTTMEKSNINESSNPVVLDDTIDSAPMPTTPEETKIKSMRHQSQDEWNILDDYVAGFTSPEPQLPEASLSPPKSISVLSDVTSALNSKPIKETPEPVKKKVSGILKIRTAVNSPRTEQNENSPGAVRTTTDLTFQHGSPETSMSPDTKRFRAFAMHNASPAVTPTKPGSRVQPRSISSAFGSKSAEATKLVQDDTLHGQLTMDLASARNPVPISFLLGQPGGSPQADSSPQLGSPSTLSGTPQQHRSAASPSPVYGKHSPKAPSSPFFPSSSAKPRSRSFSSIEVPLPMHRSESSDSLQVAYAGILQKGQLALTEQAPTASSGKKVKMLVETQLPPSVRGRVWKWLLAAPAIPHQQYQNYVDSFDIPQLAIDPSLIRRFSDHRAFMHGFQSVQQMMFLFITRHQNAPPPPDTIWIASVFLTQSFHEADAYALYECFLERMKECWNDQQLRNWAQTLQEVIQAHDPALEKHLALCPDLYHTLMRRWTLTMFAEAIPLPTCLRALDLIIVQGPSTILKLAAVIILLCSKRLQGLPNPADFTLFLLQPTQGWLSPDTVFKNMGKIALPKRGFNIGKLGSPRM
ncbi:hypothetical protein NCC49_004878 [Naganishia albida]|nr:hypothetical protein NCC49_004878 [Naganishia albida]